MRRRRVFIFIGVLVLLAASIGQAGIENMRPEDILLTNHQNRPRMPQARYIGVAQTSVAIREWQSREAPSRGRIGEGEYVYIVDYEPEWLLVVKGDEDNWVSGYVLRHTVWDITTWMIGEMPYGSTPAAYTGVITKDTPLMGSTDIFGEVIQTLTKGTKVAILEIEDGWAKVIYWRQYAYFYADALEALTPVYDLDTAIQGDTISAFVSFYNLSQKGLNPNRMYNIALACDYISVTLWPGEEFSFNNVAGPYNAKGYLQAMSYFEGEAVPSSGGGTCQVSSTLYNVLLPLEGGITILHRRPHGPSGAVYLPHGVDAAVGSKNLNLIFRNDFPFTVRIEASAQDGVLYIALRKG